MIERLPTVEFRLLLNGDLFSSVFTVHIEQTSKVYHFNIDSNAFGTGPTYAITKRCPARVAAI
jgi:hypothetical protein